MLHELYRGARQRTMIGGVGGRRVLEENLLRHPGSAERETHNTKHDADGKFGILAPPDDAAIVHLILQDRHSAALLQAYPGVFLQRRQVAAYGLEGCTNGR